MNFESNEIESGQIFYGSSRLEEVETALEKMEEQRQFKISSMNTDTLTTGTAQDEPIESGCDVTEISYEYDIDTHELVVELEEDMGDEVDFVEENSLMVGY